MKKIMILLTLAATFVLAGFVGTAPAQAGNDWELDCSIATLKTPRPLTNGDHINVEIIQNGVTSQFNAYVDLNIAGGHNGLGVRVNGHGSYPLTAEEVGSGLLNFHFRDFIVGDFQLAWVQFNDTYFNQDRAATLITDCKNSTPTPTPEVPEETEPPVTTPPATEPPVPTDPELPDTGIEPLYALLLGGAALIAAGLVARRKGGRA